ncbi:PF12686 domain protein [Leptospira noguchii str. Bonito]|nr:PF12686 domain protein [Leptospira noguchii str. Bonito]
MQDLSIQSHFISLPLIKLLKELLEYLGGSINLYFDEYSGKNSEFQREFKDYITKKNTEYYFKKVEQLEMFQSSDHPFIQVADLIAGVLKNQMKNKNNLFELIEEKCIFTRVFPY